jgi:hypothetical protein
VVAGRAEESDRVYFVPCDALAIVVHAPEKGAALPDLVLTFSVALCRRRTLGGDGQRRRRDAGGAR